MSVILKMNTNSFPGIQLLKPCDFNEPILKNYSMIKVRDLLTKKLLCPIEQSRKHQGVQGGPGVSGWSGRSGVKGWQGDQGGPRLGGPSGQPGGYAFRKYGVHVV